MEFTSKTVRSRPGLSQEAALDSLQTAPFFTPGTKIASLKLRGNQWEATLSIPKEAGPFPPKEDSGSDDSGDSESAPPSDGGEESSDSPPSGDSDSGSEGGDKPPSKGDKPGSDAEVVQLLTQILHALQGGPPVGGPDDLGPGAGGPPAPPPHGGPAGGPAGPGAPPKGGMGAGRPLKPGEVPNKPGVMPVGSPAFSHTHQAGGMMGGPGPMAPPAGAAGGAAPCPSCGTPTAGGQCPTCGPGGMSAAGPSGMAGSPAYASLRQSISKVAGRTASMTITAPDPKLSVSETVRLVRSVAEPLGYKVKQAKRTNDGYAAVLLSVR